MSEINVFELFSNSPQRLFWQDLEDNKTYDFILIQPFYSKTITYAKGYYSRMAVEINNSTCLNGLDVGIGENVILDFPTKTLLNSLCRTNLTFRKQVEKQENIRLVFIKKNKQRIKLVSIERMECTEEQNLFARNVYSGKWDSLEFEINNRGE